MKVKVICKLLVLALVLSMAMVILLPVESVLATEPDTPSNSSPLNGDTNVSVTPTLESSAFHDSDPGDTHTASNWQIRTESGNYDNPAFKSLDDELNLTSITVSSALDSSTTYYWRVQHQDNNDDWSGWSSETSFTPNLPPVADAGPNQEVLDVDESGAEDVTLDGSDSYDPDGTIVSYEWKEGDTVLSNDASFTHSYPLGLHVVTLTVTDNDGGTDFDWLFLTVKKEGGCFIATAAYGTPMAEEIQVLREFRDQYLLTNPVGEALVDFYYKVSPPMAEFITEHPALKPVVRVGLVPAIAMSTVAVNTTLAQKIAIVSSMVLLSTLLVIWLRKRVGKVRGNAN